MSHFKLSPLWLKSSIYTIKLRQTGSKWQVIYTFSWLCGGWCKCTRVDILFQLLYWYSLLRGNCFIIGAVITTSQLVVRDQIFSRAVSEPSWSFTVQQFDNIVMILKAACPFWSIYQCPQFSIIAIHTSYMKWLWSKFERNMK